jgi:hypothetical protein
MYASVTNTVYTDMCLALKRDKTYGFISGMSLPLAPVAQRVI